MRAAGTAKRSAMPIRSSPQSRPRSVRRTSVVTASDGELDRPGIRPDPAAPRRLGGPAEGSERRRRGSGDRSSRNPPAPRGRRHRTVRGPQREPRGRGSPDGGRLRTRGGREQPCAFPSLGRRHLRAAQGTALPGRVLPAIHEVPRQDRRDPRQPRRRGVRQYRSRATPGVQGQLLQRDRERASDSPTRCGSFGRR